MKNKIDRRRIAFALAIIFGLVIGIFIKRVPLGILIGLGIGLLAGGLVKSNSNGNES